jgi:hypothetical protein
VSAGAPKTVSVLGLAVGLGMALAANLTYAVPRGPVVVGLGLAAPIVLPLVLYIRSTFAVDGFWRRACRELAMVAVAGPAVAISYSHTFALVLAHGEPWLIALVAPLSSDGVAGMSTMALHWARRGPAVRKTRTGGRPAGKAGGDRAGVGSGADCLAPPPAPPTKLEERGHQRAAMVAWLEDRDPARATDEIAALRAKFGCSLSTAKRVRRDAGRVAS